MKRRWLLQLAAGIALIWLARTVLANTVPASKAGLELPEVSTARPPTGEPVVEYTLRARLDEVAHHVHGEGTLIWRNTSAAPQREIYLHLYLNAFRDDKSIFMREGEDLDDFRGGSTPSHWGGIDVEHVRAMGKDLWADAEKHTPGDPDDATDVRLALPEAVPPGGALTLELAWVSRLPSVVIRTGFAGSFHMVAQWFPKIARLEPDGTWAHFPFHRLSEFYADFGSYDVTVDVPAGFTVGATGLEKSRLEADGRRELRFTAERVHDFAFVAWDGFASMERTTPGGVALTCLYPEGLDGAAELQLDETAHALGELGEAYGEYPYPRLTLVHPPLEAAEAGGMEYPMLIGTGGHWLAPILGARTIQVVTVHELAHQWFYGLLASNEHRWPFLDEGLTTYASQRVLEDRYPDAGAYEGLGFRMSLWAIARAGAARVWDRGIIARPAKDFDRGRDYGDLVYARTATLLETVRRVYGADKLDAALSAYAARQRFGHPEPADLLAAVTEHVGKPAADNLRAGLMDGGWVDFVVEDLEGGPIVVRRNGSLAFPIVVQLWSDEGVTRELFGVEEDTLVLERPEVWAVIADPDHTVLVDHDLANNVRRAGRSVLAPRVLTQASLAIQLLLAAVAP